MATTLKNHSIHGEDADIWLAKMKSNASIQLKKYKLNTEFEVALSYIGIVLTTLGL